MNIRLRLTLWYTTILFLILIVFSGLVYLGLSYSLLMVLDDHLQREAAQVIGAIKFEPDHDEDEDGDHQPSKLDEVGIELEYIPEEGVYWRVLDLHGQPLIDPGFFDAALFDLKTINTEQVQLSYATLADNTRLRVHTVPFVIEEQGAGIVQIAESYGHVQEVQRQLVFLLAVSLPFVLLATSAGGWFLAASALAPINRITQAANQISAEDLSRRLNLKLPNDEVGRLAATFDRMLARLEDGFERQKRFIADASHEMRTPLTILKGDVEVALNRPRTPAQYRETLEMVNQTADRLTALVEELFLLARADNNQYPLQPEPLDLAALLASELSRLRPQARKKEICLTLDAPESLPMTADRVKLARLFMNLIDNALKYSGPGDEVKVTAAILNQQAWVTIADTGPGIPSEHLPHLFERFYRVDKARARSLSGTANINSSSGAGLGLSIAQWLVQIHGGRIEVESQPGQGTVFTVWLPLEPKKSSKRA
jgi:heavy metal sensor kinase